MRAKTHLDRPPCPPPFNLATSGPLGKVAAMRLCRLTLTGFRCFGPAGAAIDIGTLTALVGANGSGKSAALMGLVRMFGTTNPQRTLTREDFHVPLSGSDGSEQLKLRIETWFELPELETDRDALESAAVPECLRHIIVTESGPIPICRIRLDGTWTPGPSLDGEVEQSLSWVNSDAVDAPDDKVHPLSGVERRLIQAFYVPATRDAVRELRAVSGTILTRVLSRIPWSDQLRTRIMELDRKLTDAVRSEPVLGELEAVLRGHWSDLYGATSKPSFTFADADLAGVLRRLDAEIAGPAGSTPLGLLSEGERSLLYFALVESALTFEAKLAKDLDTFDGTPQPVLTLLLVEEPENHLAPQYLGRILKALRGLVASSDVQAVLSSHSASIMRRVDPTEVRHFWVAPDGARRITKLSLPDEDEEAFKYVREAVQAYPELYFASVVVLGEGASEEVVLPRIARALDLDIDPRFVAVVPLGGRHVRHFWRLLSDIGTPYVTLVDLDNERHGGGWQRIHSLLRELLDLGLDAKKVRGGLSSARLDELRTWQAESVVDKNLASWIVHLEAFDVFLNVPLDLDFAMLSALPKTYKSLAPDGGGPRFPKAGTDPKPFATRVTRATLGPEGGDGSTYTANEREFFAWYAYHFANGSKPAIHALALAKRNDEIVAKRAPEVLRRMVARVKELAPK